MRGQYCPGLMENSVAQNQDIRNWLEITFLRDISASFCPQVIFYSAKESKWLELHHIKSHPEHRLSLWRSQLKTENWRKNIKNDRFLQLNCHGGRFSPELFFCLKELILCNRLDTDLGGKSKSLMNTCRLKNEIFRRVFFFCYYLPRDEAAVPDSQWFW